tara:strand:- start:4450 stop:4797 length:348 start_codon:yes stop_codon:yes gene_type:complete
MSNRFEVGTKVRVDIKGNNNFYKVLDNYSAGGFIKYTLCEWDNPHHILQVMTLFVKPEDWVEPMAEYTEDFIGKTVLDVNADEDDLKIHFTDGTTMCISAEMSQGQGYLVYGDQS